MKNGRYVPEGTTATPTPAPVPTNESSEFPESPSTFPTLAPTAHRELPLSGVLLEIGNVLANRYEILEILGQGGMGAVYKAQDLQLEREVALKVIRPELASDPEVLQRFKHELILARQVSDRNVCQERKQSCGLNSSPSCGRIHGEGDHRGTRGTGTRAGGCGDDAGGGSIDKAKTKFTPAQQAKIHENARQRYLTERYNATRGFTVSCSSGCARH